MLRPDAFLYLFLNVSYQNVNYFVLEPFIKHTYIKLSFSPPPSLKVCFFTAVLIKIKFFVWIPLLLAKSGAYWFSAFLSSSFAASRAPLDDHCSSARGSVQILPLCC